MISLEKHDRGLNMAFRISLNTMKRGKQKMLQKVNVQRSLLSEDSKSKNILKIGRNLLISDILILFINYFYKKGVQMFLYVKHVATEVRILGYMYAMRMIFLQF